MWITELCPPRAYDYPTATLKYVLNFKVSKEVDISTLDSQFSVVTSYAYRKPPDGEFKVDSWLLGSRLSVTSKPTLDYLGLDSVDIVNVSWSCAVARLTRVQAAL